MVKKLLSIMLAALMISASFACTASAAVAWDTPTKTIVFGEGGTVQANGGGQKLGNLGGKVHGDEAWGWHSDSSILEGGYEYDVSSTDAAAWVFNMYADGNATAVIATQNPAWYTVLEYKPDGGLYVGGVKRTTLERGKWHRIMLWFCRTSGYGDGKVVVIADNINCTNNGDGFYDYADWGSANQSKLRFYVDKCDTAGTVAFADCVVYEKLATDQNTDNFYYLNWRNKQDIVQAYTDDNLVIDTSAKKIKYNAVKYSTPALLSAAITATGNAKYADIFTDSTMTTAATELDAANNTAVLASPNGYGYDYYSLEEMPLTDMMKVAVSISDSLKNRIKKTDNGLAVYSGTYYGANPISSTALMEKLNSDGGYTLSYADENKNEASVNSVSGGYIKAVKGSETIYLPIVGRYNEKSLAVPDDFSEAGDGADKVANVNVAGKIGSGFKYNSQSGNDKRLWVEPSDRYSTYTYSFNMYADGDAVGFIGFAEGSDLLKWNADGSISYHDGSSYQPSGITLERGRWHKMAVTYDSDRARFVFFANGELITPDGRWCPNGADMHFGSYNGSNGQVLFADFVTYEGYYDPSGDSVGTAMKDNIIADAAAKKIYYKNITSATDLADQVKALTGAQDAKLYADNTFAAEASVLDNDKNIMVLTTSGNALAYYEIAAMPDVTEIYFENASGKIKASAFVNNCDKNVRLFIASYDDNGLTAVNFAEAAANSNPGKIETEINYIGQTVRAFLWSDNLAPIRYAEYK